MLPGDVQTFAGDLSEGEKKVVWATHFAPEDGVARRARPSSYIVATKDRTVQLNLKRFLAKRMNATIYEVASSRVRKLSNPNFVIDVIRAAAKGVQKARAAV